MQLKRRVQRGRWLQQQRRRWVGNIYKRARRTKGDGGSAGRDILGCIVGRRQHIGEMLGGALPDISRDELRHVIKRQGKGKARGIIGGGPKELAALQRSWLDASEGAISEREEECRLLDSLAQPLPCITPEVEAENESRLRPIERLPCVDRA